MNQGFALDTAPYALLFPGQGAQYVGMIHRLLKTPETRAFLEQAQIQFEKMVSTSEAPPLLSLISKGPAALLNETRWSQPALFLTTLAYFLEFQMLCSKYSIKPKALAYCGHSLGQITAIVAAGALSFEQGLELVTKRGEWMTEAAKKHPGKMGAIVGLDFQETKEILKQASSMGLLWLANRNGPYQFVFSGEEKAVKKALLLAENRSAKKVVLLPVSIASHCPFMEPAQKKFQSLIESMEFSEPQTSVILNTTGKKTCSALDLKEELKRHLCEPVNWQGCVEKLDEIGTQTYLDLGPNRILEALVQHQLPNSTCLSLGFFQPMEKLLFAKRTSGGFNEKEA